MTDMRIRPYKKSDSQFLMKWLEDERTTAFWKADRFVWPLDEKQLDAYYRDFAEDPDKIAMTALNENGIPIGHFSFRSIDFKRNTAHMGFVVTSPACRGKGIGREMVRLALSYGFQCMGLERITIGVYDCNEPAIRCYESEGFRPAMIRSRMTEFHGETWTYFYLEALRKSIIKQQE